MHVVALNVLKKYSSFGQLIAFVFTVLTYGIELHPKSYILLP